MHTYDHKTAPAHSHVPHYIGGFFLALVALPFLLIGFINTPPGRAAFSSLATKLAGREVKLGGAFYPRVTDFPSLHISHLSVANTPWGKEPEMATIGKANIAFDGKDLLRGQMNISKLYLKDSSVYLEKNPEGKSNWIFSDKPPAPDSKPMTLGNVYLENSTFDYHDVTASTDVSFKGHTEGAADTDQQLILTGDGRHLGKDFAFKGQLSTSCLTAKNGPCPLDATVSVGQTSVHAKGTVDSLTPPKQVDVALDVKGADMAELYPLIGVALPPSAPYHLKGQLVHKDAEWQFADFTGTMGESDLSGTATFDSGGARPKLTARLVSKKLRFVDLGALIGIAPQTQKSEMSDEQKQRAAAQAASARVIPDIPLDIGKVSSMDADVEFTGKEIISQSLPLQDFYLKLTLDDRLMKFSPIRFGTASGNIVVYMSVDTRQEPVEDHADITFDKLTLAGMLKSADESLGAAPPDGDMGGTLSLTGHGKSLHEMLSDASGVGGIGMEGGDISHLLVKILSLDVAKSLGFVIAGDEKLPIRCLVADMNVNNGIITAHNLVFDTKDTLITANGGINLQNEMLGFQVVPAPKTPTLISLRSPIDIDGTFKKVDVSIEKGPIAERGAIAAGLAVLAPPAAVVALFDPGMGKDADCVGLMKAMHEHTKTTAHNDDIPKNK